MKKYMYVTLIALTVLSACTGCETYETEVKSDEVTVLKVVKPNNIPDFSEIVASFNESNRDIQVVFVDAPSSTEARHHFYTSALSGKDETVDLYWINDEWVDEFAEKGYIMSLDDEISIDNSRYIIDAEQAFSYDDSLYALPVGTDMDAIFYRNDIIHDLPDTWQGIVDLCRDTEFGTPVKLGIEHDDAVDIADNIVQIKDLAGLSYADALNAYKDIVKEYGAAEGEPFDGITSFKTGSAAILMGKVSLLNEFKSDTSAVKNCVSVDMLPKSADGKTVNRIKGYGIAVSANSKNKEEAVKFLDFMNSKDQQRRLSRETSVMPIIEELFGDPMISEEIPYIKEAKEIIKSAGDNSSSYIAGENLKILEDTLKKFFNNEETANNTGKTLNDLLG